VYICVNIYVWSYTYIYKYIYLYVYIYDYIFTYTFIHMTTGTALPVCMLSFAITEPHTCVHNRVYV